MLSVMFLTFLLTVTHCCSVMLSFVFYLNVMPSVSSWSNAIKLFTDVIYECL
jgi:hypothetical protein